MKDIQEMKDPEDKTLSQAERLEILLYLYNQLYKGLSEDKELLLKNITDHAGMLKDFKLNIAHFAKLESEVKDRLVKSLEDATEDTISAMDKKISDAATIRAEKVVKALEKVTENASAAFESQARENDSQFWKMLITAVMAGLAVGLLSTYLLIRHVDVIFPEGKMTTYDAGQFVQTLWPKLSKDEQQRLMDIESGKITTETERHHRNDEGDSSEQ